MDSDPRSKLIPGHGVQMIPKVPRGDLNEDDELNLGQILTTLKRRIKAVCGVSAVVALGVWSWALTRPPEYAGEFNLLVEPVTTGSRLAESLTNSDALQGILSRDNSTSGLDYISQIEVLKSEVILAPIVERIRERYPDLTYQILVKRLKVIRPKDSKILKLTYQSQDSEEIKYVLQHLADSSIQYSLSDRQTNLQQAIEFIDSQIRQQQTEVSMLERQLEQFRRQNNLIDPSEQGQSLTQQLSQLMEQRRTSQVELAAAQTLLGNLQQQVGLPVTEAVLATSLSEAPIYQNLITRLREVESQLALESARYRDNTPLIQTLQDQRQKLLPLLETEAQRVIGDRVDAERLLYQGSVARDLVKQLVTTANQVQVLRNKEFVQAKTLQQLNGQIQSMAGVSREYGQIQRNLQIYIGSLNRLLANRENLQLEAARRQSPWELISKINDDNIKDVSKTPLYLALGTLLSLLSGAGIALLLEQLDGTIHSLDGLKETNLPCLGMIPFNAALSFNAVKTAGSRTNSHYYTASFMEAFYSLDANVRLLSSDATIRSVTITSTKPGDGKSTIASHLARAAATMGRRVLLVDGDLRRPQVHHLFGIPNLRGLSQAITTDVNFQELIQVSAEYSNLFLLTAGQLPPAPGRLLDSQKMRLLAETFAKQFDFVIYDSPPLLGFADAKLTAAHTDGILLVVGLGKTERSALVRVLEDLQNTAQAPVLGIVANGTRKYADTSYYDYRYRGYYSDTTSPENRLKQSQNGHH
jgi:polysaccharide biosynthesis transport protein